MLTTELSPDLLLLDEPSIPRDEPDELFCHDLADSLAGVAVESQATTKPNSVPLALVISVIFHAALFAVAWAYVPPYLHLVHIEPRSIFTAGDPGGDDIAPAPIMPDVDPTPSLVETTVTPLELLAVEIPEASVVSAGEPIVGPSFPEAEPETASIIGLGPMSADAMTPFRPAPRAISVTPATQPQATAAPARSAVNIPPRVAGGTGRRGVRGGLDERGLPIPVYPPESRRRREQGLVELDVLIRPDGSVADIKVVSDPGFPLLVRAAVDALQNAKFDPATRDGQAVEGHLIIPFRFTLE